MKRWPALDLAFGADTDSDDEEFFLAFLHDFPVTAILEPAASDLSPPPSSRASAGGRVWRVFFASPEGRNDAARATAESAWSQRVTAEAVDVEDEPWAERSQATLRAIRVGRLTVSPPWDLAAAGREAPPETIIVIEPSMGFGTGHHESTRLCLLALQRLDLAGLDVLDLGTGSGVLALAAARLGCRRAVACDDDDDAVEAAKRNAALNQLEDRVTVRQRDLTSALDPAPVVVANLTGSLLRRHAEAVKDHVARGGRLILSGFTADEGPAILHEYRDLVPEHEETEAGWLALTLRR